ncbi:MAG: glycosyltransferase family 2 protein [Puniceicoccaceae bacterium]
MKISVVVPTYNRAHLLPEVLDSVLKQSWQDWECIICDNDSSDGTTEVVDEYIKKDERFRFIRNKENLGPVRNWTTGVEATSSEWTKILYSDDMLHPDALQRFIKPVMENPDLAFVIASDGYAKAGDAGELRPSSSYLQDSFISHASFDVSPSLALLRRDALLDVWNWQLPENQHAACLANGAGFDLLAFLESASSRESFAVCPREMIRLGQNEDSITLTMKRTNRKGEFLRQYYSAQHHFLSVRRERFPLGSYLLYRGFVRLNLIKSYLI